MRFCTKRGVGLHTAPTRLALSAVDYRNALDEDIATYILIGIAAVYFTATAHLLLLAVW